MDRPISLEARSIDLAVEPAFQLGRARVDPEAHEIGVAGKFRRVQPQTLKVLVALHDKSGRVVSRDELIDRCWGGRIVGDDVINRCISLLRPFSLESGGFRIETIPRAGYRLIVEGAPARPRRKVWMLGGAAAAAAAAIAIAAFVAHGQAAAARTLVEVEALQAAPNDRPALALGQGLGSSIERNLAGSETPVEIVDANSDRNAPLQVRGTSISDHDELRASLQLVSARSGEVIWASNFDRASSELDQLQDQISLQVARVLHCAYADGREPYFDGDFEFAKLSLAHCDVINVDPDEAVRLDAQIMRRAPHFARAWAEYAMDAAVQSYTLPPLVRPAAQRRAIALARHALALDPHQGLAYTAIGVATEDAGSWLDEQRLVGRALRADPKSPEVHNWESGQLGQIGQLQESLNEANISNQYDHFGPSKIDQIIRIDVGLGNFDDAEDELALARRYWPTDPSWDSDAVLLGMFGDAPARALQLLTTRRVRPTQTPLPVATAFLQWRIAPTLANRAAAVHAIEAASRKGEPTAEEVDLLAALGELDAAYRLAARLPSSAAPDARWFIPDLAAFRADRRFMPLAARQGLAQIWLVTGLWPDFCRTERKLSECRASAVAAVRALRPKA